MARYKRSLVALIIVLSLVPFIYGTTQINSASSLCALPEVPLRFSGIWKEGNPGYYIYYAMNSEQLGSMVGNLAKQGFIMSDIEPYESNGKDFFAGIWYYVGPEALHHVVWGMNLQDLEANTEKFEKDGIRMRDIEPYIDSLGNRLWAATWSNQGLGRLISYEKDLQTFKTIAEENKKDGYYMLDIDTYVDILGKRLWAGIWEGRKPSPTSTPTEARNIIQYQMSTQQVGSFNDLYEKNGYRLTDLETYTDQGIRFWAGVWTAGFGKGGPFATEMDIPEFKNNLKYYGKTNFLVDVDVYEPRATGEVGDVPCEDNPGKEINEDYEDK